jgi:hypothetical protein
MSDDTGTDWTKSHTFEVCIYSSSVGATCPPYGHCLCGLSREDDMHNEEVNTNGDQ